MKIGVVADTHSRLLPKQMIADFAKVDLIVHVGDFSTIDVLEYFKSIKEVKAVYGNMDEHDVRTEVPQKTIFTVEGVRIGLYHGRGAPNDVLGHVIQEFSKDMVHVVIFGHTHIPFMEKIDEVLYFCPGSPNDHVFSPYCSYGIITIKEGKASGKIIKVEDEE